MRKKYFLILISAICWLSSLSQKTAVNIMDKEVRIGGKDSADIYYAFAKDDRIIFNIYEANHPEAAEEKITAYPSAVKTALNEHIEIKAEKKSIMRFTVYNTGKEDLVCKIRIQRFYASDKTKDFLTNVVWVDKTDTTYKVIKQGNKTINDTSITGYITKVPVKTDTKEIMLIDKTIRLGPTGKGDSLDKAVILLQLPKNYETKLQTKELKIWAFWIGSGKVSEEAYLKNDEAFKEKKTIYKSVLAGYAEGLTEGIKVPAKGDAIEYCFMNSAKDADAFLNNTEFGYIERDKCVACYGTGGMRQGNYYIGIKNTLKSKETEVNMRVVAIIETKIFQIRQSKRKQGGEAKKEALSTKQMIIKTIKVPTFAE
jgi:hypothetical protein